MPSFRIEILTTQHVRKGFSCGVPVLDRYFTDLVSQDIKRRLTNCFVAVDESGSIAGFYTFAATSFLLADLPKEQTKKLPRYPLLPAALIGRLAVDRRFHGRRLGGALVMDAVARCARADPAIFAVLVDAKDRAAFAFYAHLGFTPLPSRAMSLYLPVATALRAGTRP